MDPQVIEIVQSSPAWWQSWLPLFGSLALAGAALIAVLVNNRANREAIASADERAEKLLTASAEQQKVTAERQIAGAEKQAETTRLQLGLVEQQVEALQLMAHGQADEHWRRNTVITAVADSLGVSGKIVQSLRRDDEWTDELIGDLIYDLEAGSARANVLRIVASDAYYKQWRILADALSDALLSALTLQRRKLKDEAPEEIEDAREHKSAMLSEVRAAERDLITATRMELGIEPE